VSGSSADTAWKFLTEATCVCVCVCACVCKCVYVCVHACVCGV
jgi:hypothetical protein